MKYSVLILFSSLLLLACNKEAASSKALETSDCIEQVIVSVHQHGIADSDVQTVNELFANSHINNSRFRYYQYLHDSIQTYYPPYAKFDSKTVRLDQYANGVRIFNADMIFDWYNDTLSFTGGNTVDKVHLDITSSLTLTQLQKKFIDNSEEFDGKGAFYADSCLKAEFGYFDLNAGTSNTSINLVKAWQITLLNSVFPSEYPVAFYNDDDGSLIYYNNGIETFH